MRLEKATSLLFQVIAPVLELFDQISYNCSPYKYFITTATSQFKVLVGCELFCALNWKSVEYNNCWDGISHCEYELLTFILALTAQMSLRLTESNK